jgi:hypothetical protein
LWYPNCKRTSINEEYIMGICLHSGSKTEPLPPLDYIIWGAKGHGMVVCDALDKYGYHLLAFLITIPVLKPHFQKYRYFICGKDSRSGFRHVICPSPLGFVVAIGGSRGKDRLHIADYLASLVFSRFHLFIPGRQFVQTWFLVMVYRLWQGRVLVREFVSETRRL